MKLTPQIVAMYLGGDVKLTSGRIVKTVGIHWDYVTVEHVPFAGGPKMIMSDFNISKIKLVLRKLDDITEEEIKEAILPHESVKQFIEQISDSPYLPMWSAKEFIWLLSKGFDLFGLIDEGYAIDLKTTKTDK